MCDYFNIRGSNVHVASLDASKAFDRVNHLKVLSTLLKLKFPLSFIKVLQDWFNKLSVQVRWMGNFSTAFIVKSGVRQGGILSPVLFTVYVNCLITSLRSKGLGCFIKNVYVGAIMYADDLLLLSASVLEIQRMLDLCGEIGSDIGIKFNGSKSHCMMVGPIKLGNPSAMVLNDSCVSWCTKLKYLGVTFVAGTNLSVDLCDIKRKFYASANAILCKCKMASDLVKLELMEKQCLPILLYAVESMSLSQYDLADMNSWWNSIYRKNFGYHKWESVKLLIHMLGRTDLYHIVHIRTAVFLKSIAEAALLCDDCVTNELKLLQGIINNEIYKLYYLFGCKLVWSKSKIKRLITSCFHDKF